MKRFLVSFLLLGSLLTANAQEDYAGFLAAKEITYYGLDFVHIRLFGSGFENPKDVATRYFPDMNSYVWKYKDRYGLEGLFKDKKLLYNFSEVKGRNDKIDPEKLVYYNSGDKTHLTEDSIQDIMNEYPKTSAEGYGFIFIMENFDNMDRVGTMWPVIFNTQSGEIIFTKRYSDTPTGVGLKKYWLDTVGDVISLIKQDLKSFK